MQIAAGAVVAWTLVGLRLSPASDCVISGPLPQLDSRAIEWTLVIASGDRCIRGLRSKAMTLDSVTIETPARFGEAIAQGYGFSYTAPREYKGEDSFSVAMAGMNRRVRGRSVIRVRVSVR